MNVQNIISNDEYEKLINKLTVFNTTRNTLLTFSFTAVLAVLGIAIGDRNMAISYWICLVPYFLIIPFTARISYYRLASARIHSFLKIFAPQKMIFENGAEYTPEKHGKMFCIIAWLINHEMFMLSIATETVFIVKLRAQIKYWTCRDYLICLIPTLLSIVVLLISWSTYSYRKLTNNYSEKWKQYLTNFVTNIDTHE